MGAVPSTPRTPVAISSAHVAFPLGVSIAMRVHAVARRLAGVCRFSASHPSSSSASRRVGQQQAAELSVQVELRTARRCPLLLSLVPLCECHLLRERFAAPRTRQHRVSNTRVQQCRGEKRKKQHQCCNRSVVLAHTHYISARAPTMDTRNARQYHGSVSNTGANPGTPISMVASNATGHSMTPILANGRQYQLSC